MQKEIEVYIPDHDSEGETEAELKGYINAVYVKISDYIYKLYISNPESFLRGQENIYKEKGYYKISPNHILVKNVNNPEIKKTIRFLYNDKFFDQLKPLGIRRIEDIKIPGFENVEFTQI